MPIVAEYLRWFISFYQQPLWNHCSAFIFCRDITADPRKNNKGSEEWWCVCVCTFCRHCLGAEEGGGRGEGAGWAAGVRRHLCWVRCWKTDEGSGAEGEDDRGLVCLLVWACENVSLFTFVCLAAALFWATGMSCSDPPRSLFYQSTSPLQSIQEPLLCSPQQDTLILNFALSCCFMYFGAWFQLLKTQFLLPAFICSSQMRMTWFALYTQHRCSAKQKYEGCFFT